MYQYLAYGTMGVIALQKLVFCMLHECVPMAIADDIMSVTEVGFSTCSWTIVHGFD